MLPRFLLRVTVSALLLSALNLTSQESAQNFMPVPQCKSLTKHSVIKHIVEEIYGGTLSAP